MSVVKVLWMVLFILGYLASLLSSALPIVAFEYTSNWDQVFDTFGPESLALDGIFGLFKLAFFLYGLGKSTLEGVFDTVTSVYIEIILAGYGVFLYHTIEKLKDQKPRIHSTAFLVLGFCLVLLTGFATLSHEKFQMHWWLAETMFIFQAIVLALQTIWPIVYRYWKDHFLDDEPILYKFKMIASALAIFSCILDCVSFEKEDFNVPKWTVVSLPIAIASVNAIQMVIRTIGPGVVKDYINGVFTEVADFFEITYHRAMCLIESIYQTPAKVHEQPKVLPP